MLKKQPKSYPKQGQQSFQTLLWDPKKAQIERKIDMMSADVHQSDDQICLDVVLVLYDEHEGGPAEPCTLNQ